MNLQLLAMNNRICAIETQLFGIEERLNEILAAIRASRPGTWPEENQQEQDNG